MADTLQLLDSVRRRSRRPGKGLGLAADYVASLVSCFGSPTCSTRMAKLLEGDWQTALEEAEEKLVYRNAGMKVLKETVSTSGITPGYLLEFECISTTSQKDRDGDVLETAGAVVDPDGPLLWQHIPLQPIGRHLRVIGNDGASLIERNGILDLKNPLTDDAALLVEAGALRISIGFDPQEFEPLKGPGGQTGWHVLKFEVLERSLVSIPANAGAIITQFSRGKLRSALIKGYAERLYRSRSAQVTGGYAPSAKSVVGLPDVRQNENFSCGAASLRAVSKFHGVGPESEKDFIALLGTNAKDGTSFARLVEVGKSLSLQVEQFHDDTEGKQLDSWLGKGWPVICAVQRGGTPESQAANQEGHYVVAIDSDADTVSFQDPVDGRHKEARASFLARWHDQDADGTEYVCSGLAFGPPVKDAAGHGPAGRKHRCRCGGQGKSLDDEELLECPYCGSQEIECDGEDADDLCVCDNCGNGFDREEAAGEKNMAASTGTDQPASKTGAACKCPKCGSADVSYPRSDPSKKTCGACKNSWTEKALAPETKALKPAAAKKYGPYIGMPFFEGSYEWLGDELEDSIRDQLGSALDMDDYDQACVIATFPDRAVFVVIDRGYGYWNGDGDWDEDDGYRYYTHPWAMRDGKPAWADGQPAEVELTAAVRETAKGIAAMRIKSGRAISEKNMAALKEAHGLFDETSKMADLIAEHKSACADGMKHLKEVMDGNDGGDDEPGGESVEGDYATSGEGGKASDYGKAPQIILHKGRPVVVIDPAISLKAGKVLSQANAEKCIKAYQKAADLADHEKMPRLGKSAMRECKSILKEVITGAGYDVVGKDESTDPSGQPNAGADAEANPMDGGGKGVDALCSKAVGALLGGAAPSPGVLVALKEAVDAAAEKLPEALLAAE